MTIHKVSRRTKPVLQVLRSADVGRAITVIMMREREREKLHLPATLGCLDVCGNLFHSLMNEGCNRWQILLPEEQTHCHCWLKKELEFMPQ